MPNEGIAAAWSSPNTDDQAAVYCHAHLRAVAIINIIFTLSS